MGTVVLGENWPFWAVMTLRPGWRRIRTDLAGRARSMPMPAAWPIICRFASGRASIRSGRKGARRGVSSRVATAQRGVDRSEGVGYPTPRSSGGTPRTGWSVVQYSAPTGVLPSNYLVHRT